MTRFGRTPAIAAAVLAAAISVLAPTATVAQVVDSTTLRPTDVTVNIGNDPRYSGTYRAKGMSRICGKMDLMMPHRGNAFSVEFPDDEPNLAVSNVSFDADTLPPGPTTNSFSLSVSVRTPSGATAAAFVVRAKDEPKYGEPGTAVRVKVASRDTLRVVGTATSGTKVSVSMILICHPKP